MVSLLDTDDYGRPINDGSSGSGLLSLLTGGPTPSQPVGGFLDYLQRQIGDENLRQAGLDPGVVRFQQGLLAEHPELRLPATPAAPVAGTPDPYLPSMDPQAVIDAANTQFAGNLGTQLGGTFEGPQQSLLPVRPWVRRPAPTDPGSSLYSLLRGNAPGGAP